MVEFHFSAIHRILGVHSTLAPTVPAGAEPFQFRALVLESELPPTHLAHCCFRLSDLIVWGVDRI
jgi:hypothetical protein